MLGTLFNASNLCKMLLVHTRTRRCRCSDQVWLNSWIIWWHDLIPSLNWENKPLPFPLVSVPASPDALSFVNSRKTELDYTPATLFHCELVSGKEFNRALKKTLDYFFEKRRSSHERSEEVLEWWCIDTLDEFSIVSQPSHLKTWKPKCSLQNHIDWDDLQRMENFNSVEYRGLDENTNRN